MKFINYINKSKTLLSSTKLSTYTSHKTITRLYLQIQIQLIKIISTIHHFLNKEIYYPNPTKVIYSNKNHLGKI
jgi:hypothetical protein